MYYFLLFLHSSTRWLLLLCLVVATIAAANGWATKRRYTPADNLLRKATVMLAHIQAVLGIALYAVSPLVAYFLGHYRQTVHERGIRFFGMEHSTMMLTAVALLTVGAVRARRAATDARKFRTETIFFVIALLVILINIPWPFSPMAARPWVRGL